MRSFLLAIVYLIIAITVRAQVPCGTVQYVQQLIKANPSLKFSFDNARNHANNLAFRPDNSSSIDTIPNQIITIPVVIHVLYNNQNQNISDAQILSQLVSLNQDYRRQNADTSLTPDVFKSVAGDAKIQFCLAQVDPNGRSTSGIIRKYTSVGLFIADDAVKYSAQGGDDAWDCTKYLNIWVCNLISYSLGYASPPGGPADRDGVVIGFNVFGTVGNLRTPYDKGRTATHEIGHWLGLRHTWGDAVCGDDSIPDTPEQETYNYGCPSFPHLSSCSPNVNGDMFMNYMDFSNDACMNIFTRDQVKVMRALFSANGVRNSFLSSFQCDSNLVLQAGPLPGNVAPDTVISEVINVYPNPVHTQLFVVSSNINKVTQKIIHIYNTLGMEVYAMAISQSKTIVNVGNLANGVYILRIDDGKTVYTTTRLIKE